MFKVVIVDDEPIIRKGLKTIVNWKQLECEICGEAADGQEGCELIRRVLPDIIFTDIRMPGVDGLAMIREIKETVPSSKIIILTGHRDFDYIQEAIQLGAFDFILKPSKIEELTGVIKRAVKELNSQKDKVEEINRLKALFEQSIPMLREKLLYDIIYEINTNINEIGEKLDLFQLNIDSFILAVVESEREEAGIDLGRYEKHLYQFGIINTFEEVFSDAFKVLSIPLDNRRAAFVVKLPEPDEACISKVNDKCVNLQEIIGSCFGFTITIAVSSCGQGAMDLPLKLKECNEALEHKFYIGNNSIICYKDLSLFFKYEDDAVLERHEKELLKSVKSGDEKNVRSKLEEIFCCVDEVGDGDRDRIKNFYWNIISSINNIKTSVSMADDEKYARSADITSLYKLIQKCEDIKDLNDILEEVAVKTTAKINSFNNRGMKLILRKAMDYIQQNYSSQVTLNEVAECAYVSSYYLSRIFKKEMGKNFVDYLNEVRVEKAKELMKDVRYKTYEVAEMVGIPDAHYFSRLFKKYAGVTPTEYRDSED